MKFDSLYLHQNTIDYIYIMNQLGDVTHIITTSGTVAVEYKYDAYGNIVEIIGDTNIANANSFRYRSYKYDTETDLYYLNSRYYNPEIGRFINADGLLGKIGNVQSTNMYAYCANNPIMSIDPSGDFSWKAFLTATVIVAAVALATVAVVATAGAALVAVGRLVQQWLDPQ